jgi:hypothetical protein
MLRGPLADESALHGVLMKVRDLALPLLALSRENANGLVQEYHPSQALKNNEGEKIC